MTYTYRGKHPYHEAECRTCEGVAMMKVYGKGFCSLRCSRLGAANPGWKGDEAGYMAAHGRVYRARGKASECIFGDHAGPHDWANLMGDYPDVADYAQMCRSCHARFDAAVKKCLPSKCGSGKHVIDGPETVYSKIRNGGEVRQCRQCAKDRAAEKRKS
jgi:hypothetical protein